MRRKLLCGFMFLGFVGQAFSHSGSLQSDFEKLKALRVKVLREGADEKDMAEFRLLRDAFVRHGDTAAEFLIGKLRQMNAEEARYEKDLNDIEGGLSYAMSEVEQQKDGLAKYDVCFILADVFPSVSTANQVNITKALQESYMPSNYGREDMQFLHHAMLRIGKKSVPTLLNLATNHPAELVRCGVSSVLSSLADDFQKENPQFKPFPTTLDCKATLQNREQSAAEWQRWWTAHEDGVVFPVLPDIYDL